MALKDLKKVLRTLSKPIIEEFPLFMLTLVIANLGALRIIHGRLVTWNLDTDAFEKIFRFFSIGTMFSYIFATITYYAKNKFINILFYGVFPLYCSSSTSF